MALMLMQLNLFSNPQKELTWQGRKYHTRTAADEKAGRTSWDAKAGKWVVPLTASKEADGSDAIEQNPQGPGKKEGGRVGYSQGGKVDSGGGLFNFPTSDARSNRK